MRRAMLACTHKKRGSGHFVAGLSARDFAILVDGKPVEIANCDVVTEDTPRLQAYDFSPNVSTNREDL